MKYTLIQTPNDKYSAKQQILINRGMKEEDLAHYMNLTDKDINPPEAFGEELMTKAAKCLIKHLNNDDTIGVIVDCDCDGYTSAAIMINYIYDLQDKAYVQDKVRWFLHESKQHGLTDAMDWIREFRPKLIIVPDAGSNDIDQLVELYQMDIDVIILDHHEIEDYSILNKRINEIEDYPNADCYLINSQSPEYPNKFLSGAGVVYQFCKYVSKIKGLEDKGIEDWYLDLVALGLDGDMMSLQSYETRRLISKGLNPANIHNPFMYEMWQKNMFKLGDHPTAWGVTFYIVPFVNAITRSGTQEEKELIFKSMLKFLALDEIPSNKRGHKAGEMEKLVTQAVRTCTNVKNRQTRAEEAGIELVTHLIKDNNMLDHKVLLFLLEPGQIQPEIRGLIANKLMAKYQRPCCMLTKVVKEDGRVVYEGSARGCDKVGITEFKDICAATGACDYTVGHQGAFGLGITVHYPDADEVDGDSLYQFIDKTDELLKDMASEPIYYVDYIWSASTADPQKILDIAEMDEYWGKDCDESLIAIQGLEVTKDNLTMMASNTVKITLPNGISLIKFRMPDEEYNKLYTEDGLVEINVVGKCNANEWNGNITPQIIIEDYEIVTTCAYVF